MSIQTRATKFGYGVFTCIKLGLKERGLRGVLKQLCAMGEIKLGTLKGQDEHGNMYYECLKYQFGRHRWVEYAGWNWRFDYMQIAPQWLGWVASLYDEVPSEQNELLKKKCADIMNTATLHNSANPYKTNMGGVVAPHEENLTQMRYRSYKRWGFKDPQKEDMDWLPPQHPLYMETARKMEPDVQEWVPHRA
ncbi:hypothetical protein WA538_002901 [Blastocystis sp. DL]